MKDLKRLIIIIVAVMVILSTGAVYANTLQEDKKNSEEDEKIYDPTFSSMQDLPFYDSEINNNNIAKYRFNYSLDINLKGDSSTTDAVLTAAAMNGISNALLQAQRSMIEIMIFMCYKAFNFKSFDIFKYSILSILQKNFSNKIYIVISLVLLISGSIYFIKYARTINYRIKFIVLKVLIGICILVVLFIKPIALFQRIDSGINSVTGKIFETSMKYTYISDEVEFDDENNSKIKTDENKSMIILASTMWNQYVHKPWRLMEFGNEELADIAEYDILQYEPSDSKRLEIIKEIESGKGDYEEFKGFESQEMPEKRLGFILIYFVPIIVNFLVIAAVCLLMIGYHFIILFMMLIGILILAVSIGIKFNTQLLKQWFYKFLGLVIAKFFILLALIFILNFNNILFLYTSQSKMGWVFAMVAQIGIYAIVYFTRLSFIDFLRERLKGKAGSYVLDLIGGHRERIRERENLKLTETSIGLKKLLNSGINKLPESTKKRLNSAKKVEEMIMDISYGPFLKIEGNLIHTYLIISVDSESNEIISGEFYLNKSIDTVLMAFEDSVEKFGIPNVLRVENDKIINSSVFNKLSKQEKFKIIKFKREEIEVDMNDITRNIRTSFIKKINIGRLKSLDQLNLDFKKWIVEHSHNKDKVVI
jgi:hypothetical protein